MVVLDPLGAVQNDYRLAFGNRSDHQTKYLADIKAANLRLSERCGQMSAAHRLPEIGDREPSKH
jgi:hypothetical protein